MLRNIPIELQALKSWVLWRYELVDGRQSKVPYSALTKTKASVIDPNTWADFETALAQQQGFNGIGLVLSESDDYCIIDLDNKPDKPCTPEQLARHTKIYEAFNSYTERSTSGTGVHIIVKGKLPSGVHRDNVEVYSSQRYMICTGDVIRNAPIVNCQPMLDILYGEMKPPESVELEDRDSILSDEEVFEMAINASNADKFNKLCAGQWQDEYGSQSEADLALLSIIAFYTPNNDQVRRLFRMTALGKRAKAIQNNTYLNFALGKIRAQQPAPVDTSQLKLNAEAAMKPTEVETEPVIPGISLPPGLLGEVAHYIYSTAFMPVPEVALAASIGLLGSICGRQYNVNGQGLSQILVLLAETGKGKEGAASGIDRIFAALRPTLPMMDEFRGPSAFASGPALIRSISERPSVLSIQGEFGFLINQLNNAKQGSPEHSLKRALMDISTKSGWFSTLQSSAYADKEKNTSIVQAPNLNILGESTPTRFFEGLDLTATEDGLVPRLLVIESKGDRPYPNRSHGAAPGRQLTDRLASVITTSVTMKNNNQCHFIQLDAETEAASWIYTCGNIDKLNGNHDPVMLLWSRAAAATIRLAGLVAVGVNHMKPVITMVEYEWARNLVERSIHSITSRFHRGDIGDGDSKQISDLRRLVSKYFALQFTDAKKYGATENMHRDKVIPYQYMVKRTYNLASFKNDKQGSTRGLERTIKVLVDTGSLVLIGQADLKTKYSYHGIAYGIGQNWSCG